MPAMHLYPHTDVSNQTQITIMTVLFLSIKIKIYIKVKYVFD